MTDNPMNLPTVAERKKEWLGLRRTCITGTDIAKVLGLSKWGSPIDVFEEKTADEPPTVEDTEPMKWGRRAEPMILNAYGEEIAPLVIEQPFTLMKHPSHPLIGATLDARRVIGGIDLAKDAPPEMYQVAATANAEWDGRPVDAKNIRHRGSEWGDAESDVMPLYYATQLSAQMFVTGASVADLAVLFGGNDFVIYRLHRDEDTIASIVERCEKFWQHYIVPRVAPPVDGSAQYTEYLKRKFSKHTEVVRQAEPAHDVMLQRYREAKMLRDQAQAALDLEANIIKAQIGDARGIHGNGWKALWSQTADSTGVDWEGIAKHVALELATRTGDAATKIIGTLATDKKFQKVTRKGSRRFTVTFDNEE